MIQEDVDGGTYTTQGVGKTYMVPSTLAQFDELQGQEFVINGSTPGQTAYLDLHTETVKVLDTLNAEVKVLGDGISYSSAQYRFGDSNNIRLKI